jgi:hypothetical protein
MNQSAYSRFDSEDFPRFSSLTGLTDLGFTPGILCGMALGVNCVTDLELHEFSLIFDGKR